KSEPKMHGDIGLAANGLRQPFIDDQRRSSARTFWSPKWARNPRVGKPYDHYVVADFTLDCRTTAITRCFVGTKLQLVWTRHVRLVASGSAKVNPRHQNCDHCLPLA